MKKCPFCAEQIHDEAIVCRYCQRKLPAPDRWTKVGILTLAAVGLLGAFSLSGSLRPSVPSSGNRAHDVTVAMSEPTRGAALARIIAGLPEHCDRVTVSYFQGFDSQHAAWWNAACDDGRPWVVTIAADATGSTRVLDCIVLARTDRRFQCFSPLPSSYR